MNNYKIGLVGDCLGFGGAEKVHATLSIFFASKGIEVHNIIIDDMITYPFAGNLFILSAYKNASNSIFNKFSRFIKFRNHIRNERFDYIIDFRMKQFAVRELLISHLIYNVPTIYSIRSGILEYYLPKPLTKYIYRKHKVVTVSKQIASATKLSNEMSTIYNPIDFNNIANLSTAFVPSDGQYVIGIGRMNDSVKQFDHMIKAYGASDLPLAKIKLLLLGAGENRKSLEQLAATLNLSAMIVFKGFCENPYPFVKNALFTILTSRNEGFPNVLIESLAVGTPVISYDCYTGPAEIINDKYNGLLVDAQRIDKMTEAMNLFIEDQQLYNHCKSNAIASVQRFSVDIIGQQWLDLMKINVS